MVPNRHDPNKRASALALLPLKLRPDPVTAAYTATGYGTGFVEINAVRYTGSLLVFPESLAPWDVSGPDDIDAESLAVVIAAAPEILIVGTGLRQRFLKPDVLNELLIARIGVEMMDTQAACRTYNILMAEGRKVGAALVIEPG